MWNRTGVVLQVEALREIALRNGEGGLKMSLCVCYVCLSKSLKRQSIDSISHEKMECAQRIWIMYIIVLSFGWLTGERH